ncbi:MAG: hypothetical protein QOI12_766 [Alphaproteobacteria bacterium]|nr:hypothetical protein [Alphaproteobacteria bacterium]
MMVWVSARMANLATIEQMVLSTGCSDKAAQAQPCAGPNGRFASPVHPNQCGYHNPPVPERIMRSASGDTATGRPSVSVTPITE